MYTDLCHSIPLLFNLQNHYYCHSPQMWQPEGFPALYDVTALPCGLFFRQFSHICMDKFLSVLHLLYISLLLFYILI